MLAAPPLGSCKSFSICLKSCVHGDATTRSTQVARNVTLAAHACAVLARAHILSPPPSARISTCSAAIASPEYSSERPIAKFLGANRLARPVARIGAGNIRAGNGASEYQSATSPIGDEQRQRLLKAKQRVADLRAVQVAGQGVAPPASQTPPVAPAAAPRTATTGKDNSATTDLRDITAAPTNYTHGRWHAHGSGSPPVSSPAAQSNQDHHSKRQATPHPGSGATSSTAANGSRGTMAAQLSSRRPPPWGTAVPTDPLSLPAFPPKNPATKRRLQQEANSQSQVFDHEAASRARLLDRLSDATRYTAHLEAEATARAADIAAAADYLSTIEQQLATLLRRAGLAAGSASRHKSCAACDILQPHSLTQQLARMQQATGQRMHMLQRAVSVEVPVHYIGVANEVRMMGSFDGWSRGVRLVCCHNTGDVFRRFEGRLLACRGEHLVKFVVDGQWKLASGWPTREDATGGENNVLRID